MSVIKLPVSTFELTFVAVILGRSMTYDVLHERFPSNGYHVAHRIAIGSQSVCMSIFQPLMLDSPLRSPDSRRVVFASLVCQPVLFDLDREERGNE